MTSCQWCEEHQWRSGDEALMVFSFFFFLFSLLKIRASLPKLKGVSFCFCVKFIHILLIAIFGFEFFFKIDFFSISSLLGWL
jgi:hypothetical protein